MYHEILNMHKTAQVKEALMPPRENHSKNKAWDFVILIISDFSTMKDLLRFLRPSDIYKIVEILKDFACFLRI